MSWYIPKFNKKISLSITFYACWWATRISIGSVLYRRNRNKLVFIGHAFSAHFHIIGRTKLSVSHTLTPTVQPIVWGGRAMEEPLRIRWTREVFPTPIRKYQAEKMVKLGAENKESLCINKNREINIQNFLQSLNIKGRKANAKQERLEHLIRRLHQNELRVYKLESKT